MRLLALLLCCTLALAVMVACAGPSEPQGPQGPPSEPGPSRERDLAEQGAGAPPLLEGDNVIEYDHSRGPEIQNPKRYIRQGRKVGDDGCAFEGYMESSPGEFPLISRTLAINWETCESLVEEGRVSPEDDIDDMYGEGYEHEEVTPEAPLEGR